MAQDTCSIAGCDRPHYCKTFCSPHYQRWRQHGDPGRVEVMFQQAGRTCTVEGCDKPLACRDMCDNHYNRWKRHGDPLAVVVERFRSSTGTCLMEGCGGKPVARGYCSGHAARIRKTGDPGSATVGPKIKGTCTLDDCDRPHSAGGYCSTHYARVRRGVPLDKPLHDRRPPQERDAQGRKWCITCATWKPAAEFRADRRAIDGLMTRCDPCQHQMTNLKKYGLNSERYAEILAGQGGGCAICGRLPGATAKKFHVDHDHRCCPVGSSCGKCVRGILCGPCNSGIGLLGDDPDRVRAAAVYLSGELW
jgi:hypothetical protein